MWYAACQKIWVGGHRHQLVTVTQQLSRPSRMRTTRRRRVLRCVRRHYHTDFYIHTSKQEWPTSETRVVARDGTGFREQNLGHRPHIIDTIRIFISHYTHRGRETTGSWTADRFRVQALVQFDTADATFGCQYRRYSLVLSGSVDKITR